MIIREGRGPRRGWKAKATHDGERLKARITVAKLLLAVLGSAIGGVAALMGISLSSIVLSEVGDVATYIAFAAWGVVAGGLALFLARYHRGGSWRDAAAEMWASFAVVLLLLLGAAAIVRGTLRMSELGVSGNAGSLTALALLGLPVVGSAFALLVSGVVLAVRRPHTPGASSTTE